MGMHRIVGGSEDGNAVPRSVAEWMGVRANDEARETGRRAFLGRIAATLVPLGLVLIGRPRVLMGGGAMGCGYCCYFPCFGTEIEAFCSGCGVSLEDCCIQCETGCCPDGCALWCEPGCPE